MTVAHKPPQPTLSGKEREELEKKEQRKDCCKRAAKFTFSQVGLIIVVILYAVAGGFIFQHLESTNEKEQCVQGRDKYLPMENDTVYKIWSISTSFRSSDDEPYALDNYRKQLSKFRDDVLSLGYGGTNCSEMREKGGPAYQWSYPSALLFATTIFTTVGYGNIAPKTFWGRLVCIAYAVLGIPLMLLVLANIGEIMANIFRYVYVNICCCGFLQKCSKSKQPDQQQQQQPPHHQRPGGAAQAPIDAWKDQYNSQKTGGQQVAAVVDDDDEDEDEEDKISVPLTVTLALVASYLFVGALLFGVWIDLDWLAAAYFCFITIATIGFGDIVPGTQSLNTVNGQLQLIGTAVYMVFGMAILSMAFNLIQDEIVAKFRWLGEKLGLVKPEDDEDKADGHPQQPQPMPMPPRQGIPPPHIPAPINRGPPGMKQPGAGPWLPDDKHGGPPPGFYPPMKAPAAPGDLPDQMKALPPSLPPTQAPAPNYPARYVP